MTRAWCGAGVVLMVTAAVACGDSPGKAVAEMLGSPTAVAREARLISAMADADSVGDPDAPLARWVLPKALSEISGLALTSDGRLFVHGDEDGQVWEIDYRRGLLLKRFSIGAGAIKADFEGITVANDVLWLLASNGMLYEFREGIESAHVEVRKHDTGLTKACEFEGVAYDATINALLLACKNIRDKQERNAIVIYRWSLKPDSAGRVSRVVVPVASVRGSNGWNSLQIADITVDPQTGNYVLLASKERAIVAITPTGGAVFARSLPEQHEQHEQPEGLAVTKDGLFLVSDEAVKGPALITLYRWP
ncbi:MAG: SdiA-regulated domain-containing protein [Gemmatimonadaceae bacterium]|nr:SdiA-regulated domain-containing protein [Gemmatimonadaceae bacterium]